MESLKVFMSLNQFEKVKRKELYNQYTTFCEKMHVPKVRRVGKVEAYKAIVEMGYTHKHCNDAEYFIKK